jgi:hypothetical protein
MDFDEDTVWTFAWADIVMADLASGAFTESIFLNKKAFALASQRDVENVISPQGFLNVITEPKCMRDFENISVDAVPDHSERLRADLVDSTHGHDGERAAQIIAEILSV